MFPQPLHWTAIAAIPALFLIAINAVWVSLVFGILSTRYRDISPLLGSIVQLLFFMTPIIWTEQTLVARATKAAPGSPRSTRSTTSSTSSGPRCSAATSSSTTGSSSW